MCTRYGSSSGAGSHCAITPANRAPQPNPADNDTAARRAPAPDGAVELSSFIQAVPAPNAMPEASPASTRPR